MSIDNFNVSVKGHVSIFNQTENRYMLDKFNAVHPQNMARIIARALAREPNSYIYRLALGNGGAQYVTGQVVINPPIDGRDGSGWESRLYNETYSEIVDDTNVNVGSDPGSSDASGVRPGGGSDPNDDSAPDSVVSQEVGTKSNIIVTMYLNQNEPSGQIATISDSVDTADAYFDFNELGLYSFGKPAVNSSGYSSINVGNKTSTATSALVASTQYTISLTVDGVPYNCVVKTPATGTGTSGTITFGDICEGINSGNWIISGDPINDHVYTFITDDSNGTYPSILARQSYGMLTFESRTSGASSNVTLNCTTGNPNDVFNTLVNGICGYVNYKKVDGINAGVANDSLDSTNERERLLTHLTFPTLRKSQDQSWVLTYTLTVSVSPTVSTVVNELQATGT